MSKTASICNRRDFLRQSALLGLGLCATGVAPLAAQAAKLGRDGHAVSSTRAMIGTLVHITAVHPSKDLAQEAVGRAYEEIERLSAIFDRYKSATAISELNSHGRIAGAPDELLMVLDRAQRYTSLSDGAFDVTVAPVVDLFKAKADAGERLDFDQRELSQVMELVGARHLSISGRDARFDRNGMAASLDGIAKGYIVDRASEVLSSHGIENHLVNAGGDIRTSGANAKGKPWTIAVEDPAKQGHYPSVVTMRNGAIATSGNYEVYFDHEKLFHHIISPVTGLSPHQVKSVSVQASSVLEADALSTTVFVMGPQQGIAFVNSLPHRECLVIGIDDAKYKSMNWS